MSQIYQSWGFRSNPFVQTPLPATDEGAHLMVGRERELQSIKLRLSSPPKIVTIDGHNGIGKTSLVNVAAFQCLSEFLAGKSKLLLIPCDRVFQLATTANLDDFCRTVFQAVAATLISHSTELLDKGIKLPGTKSVHEWLSSPTLSGLSAQIGIPNVVSVGAGMATSANTGDGFKNQGVEDLVKTWLAQGFPSNESGGIVCSIDNMELMQTSKDARALVEQLRDRLFTIPGLRWVLCGATGIVRSLLPTPRLSGLLHDTIDVGDIDKKLAPIVLTRRREVFAIDPSSQLPLSDTDFDILFEMLNGNIREALSQADLFCTSVYESGAWNPTMKRDPQLFRRWISRSCLERQAAANKVVTPRAWQLFDNIVSTNGQCAPGDFAEHGFDTQQAMRSHILTLESANLLQSARDEDDNRRKTISITPFGWMVNFSRSQRLDTLFPFLTDAT